MPSVVTARVSSATDAAGSQSGSVASDAKRGERSLHDLRERVVHEAREADGALGRLDVRAGRRERDHLRVDAFLLEHVLAIRDVAMPAHRDVVVARIVETRIALGVDRQLDDAVARLERVEVFRRIEVVVNVNQHGLWSEMWEDAGLAKPDHSRRPARRRRGADPSTLSAGSVTI